MKAFRIGRKPAGPWPQMTPPIRGGVYKAHDPQEQEMHADPRPSEFDSMPMAKVPERSSEKEKLLDHDGDKDMPTTCPTEYTDWAVQQEINLCRKQFPCPDNVALQEKIVHRYRQLHKQVQDEGLYECPYVEYGKETLRYASLFGMFLFTLKHEWYMTSAVFLGLFWVSPKPTVFNGEHY